MEDVVEQGCYVTLVGSFNPAILNPHWMAREGILSDADADAAEIEVIHRDVTRFAVPGLKFDVTAERCNIFAEAEPFVRLVDIVGMIFLEKLPHTPIQGVSISYYIHADLKDQQRRIRFGRGLAPIEPWGEFGAKLDAGAPEKVGGLIDITMQALHFGEPESVTRVTIQPSYIIPEHTGIFIMVNDVYEEHREPKDRAHEGDTKAARVLGRTLKPKSIRRNHEATQGPKENINQDTSTNFPRVFVNNFQSSYDRARKIASDLLEVARAS